MSLGALVVSLGLDAADFVSGLTKSEQDARRFAQRMDRTVAGAIIKAEIALRAFGAAARATGQAFQVLTEGAAQFKDLEETTGASAESIASLSVAAATAGVGIEDVAGSMNRLTKSLVGVDDESKAAGAAVKALGLDVEKFKQLDPAAQYEAVAKALSGYADGASKVAVAQALFGKSGAEQLKVFKAMEEQGGRMTILTQQQIEQADAYADAQAKAGAEIRLYAQAAATQALPALTALTGEISSAIKEIIGLDKETGKLAANNGVKEFAQTAAVYLGYFVDDLRKSVAGIASFVATTEMEFAGAKVLLKGPFASGDDIANFVRLREEAQKYAKALQDAGSQSIGDSLRKRFDLGLTGERMSAFNDPRSTLFGSTPREMFERPKLSFSGAADSKRGGRSPKSEIDEITKSIQTLEEELALFGQSDAFTKAFKLEGLGATAEQVEAYRANLAKLEELKTAAAIEEAIAALVKERDELGLTNDQLAIHRLTLQGAGEEQIKYAQSVLEATKAAREQKDAIDEGKRLYDETRTPVERLNIELAKYNELLQRGAIDWDTYSRAVFSAQDRFDSATKNVAEEADSFTKRFAENTQDLLGQGLYDAMTGNFKNIGDAFAQMITRMVAEAAAAELARTLFGDLVKGGSGGGWLGDLVGSAASFFGGGKAIGGPTMSNTVYQVGERGPEVYDDGSRQWLLTGSRRGRIDPSPMRERGGDTYYLGAVNVDSQGYMDRAAEDRSAARIVRTIESRMRRRSA